MGIYFKQLIGIFMIFGGLITVSLYGIFSGAVPPPMEDFMITEAGDYMVDESGNRMITE